MGCDKSENPYHTLKVKKNGGKGKQKPEPSPGWGFLACKENMSAQTGLKHILHKHTIPCYLGYCSHEYRQTWGRSQVCNLPRRMLSGWTTNLNFCKAEPSIMNLWEWREKDAKTEIFNEGRYMMFSSRFKKPGTRSEPSFLKRAKRKSEGRRKIWYINYDEIQSWMPCLWDWLACHHCQIIIMAGSILKRSVQCV